MIIFQVVVVAVCVVSALVATTAFLRSRGMYEQIGRLGTFWLASEDEQTPPSAREIEEMRAAITAARLRRQAKSASRTTRPTRATPPLDAP